MKTKNLLITLVFSLIGISNSIAQCNTDPITEKMASKLGDFTFLKSYKVDGNKSGVVEYSYVFSKDTQYLLIYGDASDETAKVLVTLYDGARKELASNFDKKNNKFLPGIGYKCTATGIYYMTFSLKEADDKCGVSVLGFKK
ncbi:MAG: hypothetical protein SNJ77_00270 [Cytophagales bacterium]